MQPLAGLGQADAAGRAQDQGDAEVALEAPDRLADGRPRHAEPVRRRAEAALLGHQGEDGQRVEVSFHWLGFAFQTGKKLSSYRDNRSRSMFRATLKLGSHRKDPTMALDKVILITGASSGIGAGIARELAAHRRRS